MIFVSTARVTDDPSDEYFRNQSFAVESWKRIADAIVFFGPHQEHLASPITRFLPSEDYPLLRDVVNFCADQTEWCAIVNADIWIHPVLKRLEAKLKSKKAVAASSWRFEFDPARGVEPCEKVDNGLDFFAATPGVWEMIYQQDAPKYLRLGAPTWDSWLQGAFFARCSSGLYDLTDTRCVRHPKHAGRKHGGGVKAVHYIGWPCMGISILQ